MAAQPPNPLANPPSSILAGLTNPGDELKQQLAERRKKAMQAANLDSGGVSQLLMGMPSGSQQ